jgi:hypothetical protein
MDRSIKRDRKELEFHTQRLEESDGSLESQLRAAKTRMIEERVLSKEEKLQEMYKTEKDLGKRIESLNRRKEQQELEEKLKAEIKEKIAQEIKEAEKARSDNETIQKAAEAIQGLKIKPEAPLSLDEKIEDSLENIVDTVKAVASVIEDKFRDVMEDWRRDEEE